MPDAPSREALLAIARAEAVAVNPDIDPAQFDTPGSEVNLALAAGAALAEEVLRQQVRGQKNQFLDSGEDEGLDRWVFDRYREERHGATSAIGQVQFTRPTFAAGAGTLAAGFRVATSEGVEYETTEAASFGAASLVSAPANVRVRAVVAGLATQVTGGTLVVMRSSAFDPTIAVTNAAATSGGNDRETDAEFAARAARFFTTARRGVVAAIEAGALSVAEVRFATAVEAVDELARPARFVDLYAADASGVMNASLAADVADALLEYRAAGIYVRVNEVLPTFVDVRLRLAFDAGIDTVAATAQVRAAVVNAVNTLAPNETLRVSAITAAIRTIAGVIAPTDGAGASGGVVAPVGDLVPAPGQTIRTTLDRVTVE